MCKKVHRNPKTKAAWQYAVDTAHALLALDAARQYGLVTGGPTANLDRCIEIIERGKKMGIRPSKNAIRKLIDQVNGD